MGKCILSPTSYPPIEAFNISKEEVIKITKEARQKLFAIEKQKTYCKIFEAAEKGNYYIEYKYPENCNYEDIKNLETELINKGFKAKLTSNAYGDTLEISWYPE